MSLDLSRSDLGKTVMDLLQRLDDECPDARVLRTITIAQVENPDGEDYVMWESNTDYVGEIHLCEWVAEIVEDPEDPDD
jgi:hypothetical protein